MSEVYGDPPDSQVRANNMDMEEDENDSDYVANSEDGKVSSEGDESLVEEIVMDLLEEAPRFVR